MGLLGDARWPRRKMAARAGRRHRNSYTARSGNIAMGTRPARGPHFVSLHPPGLFNIPRIVGIGDMCAVWEGRARGKMPYAGGVGAVLEEWQRQRQRQWRTVSSRAAYSWFRAGARRPAFPRVGRGGPWAGKGGGRSARGEPAGRKGSGRANGSVPRSHFFPHFLWQPKAKITVLKEFRFSLGLHTKFSVRRDPPPPT